MKILRLAIVASLAFFAVNSFAARPGYTYVGIGYTVHYLDNDCTQDGIWLDGSLSLDGQIFFQGTHSDVTGDNCGSTRTSLSAGLRNDYGQSSSAYGKATLIFQRNNGDTDPGISVTGGLRSMQSSALEVNLSLTAEIMDDFDQNYITGGARYNLAPGFSVLGDITLNDHGTKGIVIGGRYSF